ncbi:hypothetical protein ACJ41O_001256 [Fusarium nematophilum]
MAQVVADVTRVINAPIGQIWGIVTSFGAESLWFPGVVTSSLEGYGLGSVRTLHFENGPWGNNFHDEMVVCDPAKHLLRYRVLNDDFPDAGEVYPNIVLEGIDGKSTKLRWFLEGEPMPDEVQRASLRKSVEAMYNRCADAIAEKLAPK